MVDTLSVFNAITEPGVVSGPSVLIASAIGVDLNTIGDTAMTLSAFAAAKFFVVDYVLVTNTSIPLTDAAADVWSGAAGTGQQYSAFGAAFTNLATTRDWVTNTGGPNQALGGLSGAMQNTAPIVHVNTPQGAPATADFYVFGRLFT